jgi:hypothetical protein
LPWQILTKPSLPTRNPPKETPGDVRAFFPDGQRLTFQLESWNKESMAGTSPTFGRVKFISTAFATIQYHPEPADEENEESADESDQGESPSAPVGPAVKDTRVNILEAR